MEHGSSGFDGFSQIFLHHFSKNIRFYRFDPSNPCSIKVLSCSVKKYNDNMN